jgi:hypothetical protein
MQLKVRDMVVEWMQQRMIESGFYCGSNINDECAHECAHVL